MQKPTRKIHPILLGTIIILVIIYITFSLGGIGEDNKKEDSQEFVELEQALMRIEGVGEVFIYLHYENGESSTPLTDYFSLSSTTAKKGNGLQGILVIAEGADDMKIRNKLSKILTAVLQLPEHRIVIEEMKKRGNTIENE